MRVTEVRIFPKDTGDKKLLAFATVTFDDCFVVRDLKIIEGLKGTFISMPSRRMKFSCPKCGHRNVVHSHYCNRCGQRTPDSAEHPIAEIEEIKGRQSEHKDIAHPITLEFREHLQSSVLEAYRNHLVHAHK